MHHFREFTDWRNEPTWNHTTGSKPLADDADTVLGPEDRDELFSSISNSQLRPDSTQYGAGNISQCLTRQRARLRHMPIAANVPFALGRITIFHPSFLLPRRLSSGGENPPPVWPAAPQNPWPSLYVGLATLSTGRAFHPHALNQFLASPSIIFSPFLKPELQRNSLFSLGFPDTDAFRTKIWKEFKITNIYV